MRFVLALVLVLVPLMPVLGGWVEERDGRTIIHIKLDSVLLPDPSRTDPATRANVAAVREFKRLFPELLAAKYRAKYEADPDRYGSHDWSRVEVELHRATGIQVEGVESVLLALAGGVAPDVMYVNFRQSDTYIQQRFLYPLDRPEDHYLASMTEEEADFRIHPKIWSVIARKGPDGEKHVWAIPYGGALGKIVTYRRDLFDEAGVAYPTNDWTWTDFMDACRKITDPSRGIYGAYMGRGKQESWYWMTFLWSAGGDAMAYDEASDQWRAVFDSPEAALALDFYTRLCTEPWTDEQGRLRRGYVLRDTTEGQSQWDQGRIGMLFQYIDEKAFSTINPDLTGMAPVPRGPTGLRGGELNSRMMGLFSGIKDPVVRDAAWEYIRFYDSEEAVRIKTRVMVEGGMGRFLNPRYLEMCGYTDLIRLSPKGWKECFDIAMESGRPEPYGRNANYAYNIMTEPLQKAEDLAMRGELPDDDAQRLAVLQDLLETAVTKANREMLALYTPEERRARRITGAAAFAVIVLAFVFGFRRIIRTFAPGEAASAYPSPGEGKRSSATSWGLWKYRYAYLLLLPAALTILLWQYVPLGRGSLMAFQDYRLLGGSAWVWLDNFGDVLWNADWWRAVWNSVRYSTLVLSLTFLPPVILAILLQEVPRGKMLFRLLFYLPAVMTGLVVILLWKMFYDPSERGALNHVLLQIPAAVYLAAGAAMLIIALKFYRRLAWHGHRATACLALLAGAVLFYTSVKLCWPMLTHEGASLVQRLLLPLPEPVRWLGNSETAMLACVLPLVWAGVGPGCLIYLAALKSVSDDLYEAADLDGATFTDKVLFIIFPVLKYLLIINFVGVFIHSWNAEANILAMTGGAAQTEVVGLHIFYKAFIYLKFGPATAMAWLVGCLLIGFTAQQLRMLARMEFRTVGDGKG
jgi:ABC-type sugar transport system permease subunit/ABC-type glycerol-3-phosphate transport system substrate-binding protein